MYHQKDLAQNSCVRELLMDSTLSSSSDKHMQGGKMIIFYSYTKSPAMTHLKDSRSAFSPPKQMQSLLLL